MFSAGIILAVEVSIYIFGQWEWFMPFCSDDFPGQYKRLCKRSLPLFLTPSSNRTDQLWRGERFQFFWLLFSLENHSFIIYSFLLDQLILEASSWMLYSCSNIRNCFLPYMRLTVQGYHPSWHWSFWNSSIFSSTHLFYSFLNVTG